MRLVFTAEARIDLVRIGDFIAKDNARRAITFVDELETLCRQIPDLPLRYPLLTGYERTGVRRVVHSSYLIFYRLTVETIEILRVLHGAQDYEAILFPRE